MSDTILFLLCDSFASMSGVPVQIMENGQVLYHTGNTASPVLPVQAEPVRLYTMTAAEGLSILYFLVGNGPRIVAAGPVFTMHPSPELRRDALKEAGIPQDASVPVLSAGRMKEAGELLFLSVNHAIPDQSGEAEAAGISLQRESVESDWIEYNDAYTGTMCFYIEHGDLEQLEELMKQEQPAPYGTLSEDILQHWKNSCFVLLYMVRTAAERGGLDPVTSLHMAEQYSRKFDQAADRSALTKLSKVMRRDYCQRVRNGLIPEGLSPVISQVLRYIRMHCYERLTVEAVAQAAGISVPYLCARIRKETGLTVNNWVQKEKARAAEELLRFTDLSIAAIAERLSYSSQSHFQKAFKTVTGTTPAGPSASAGRE